jgi:hypothetical protein
MPVQMAEEPWRGQAGGGWGICVIITGGRAPAGGQHLQGFANTGPATKIRSGTSSASGDQAQDVVVTPARKPASIATPTNWPMAMARSQRSAFHQLDR